MTLGQKKTLRFGTVRLEWKTGLRQSSVGPVVIPKTFYLFLFPCRSSDSVSDVEEIEARVDDEIAKLRSHDSESTGIMSSGWYLVFT